MTFKWFINLLRGFLEENPLIYICFAIALAVGVIATVVIFVIVKNIKRKPQSNEKRDMNYLVDDVQNEFIKADSKTDFDAKLKLIALLFEKVIDTVGTSYYSEQEEKYTLFEGNSIKEDGFKVIMKFSIYEFVVFLDKLFENVQNSLEKSMESQEFLNLYRVARKQYPELNQEPQKASLNSIKDMIFITMKTDAEEKGLNAIARFIRGFAHHSASYDSYDIELIGPGVVSIVDNFCLDLIPQVVENVNNLYAHDYDRNWNASRKGGRMT